MSSSLNKYSRLVFGVVIAVSKQGEDFIQLTVDTHHPPCEYRRNEVVILGGESPPPHAAIMRASILLRKMAYLARYASITCATPSAVTGGQTKSAIASTRSCAFSTATA